MSGTTGGGAIALLNIEIKEDSAEVLAAVAGKPTKYYLSAAEFEILRAFVNSYAEAANDALVAINLLPTSYAPSNATANSTDAVLKDRANHTGTQLAATISDFANAVASLLATFKNANYIDATSSIQAQLSASAKVLAKKTTYGTSITGTVSETIMEQFTIPGNSLSVENIVDLFYCIYTPNSGVTNYKIKISNSNSLTGATQLATVVAGSNYMYLEQRLYCMSTGIGATVKSNNANSFRILDANTTSSRVLATLDFTQPIYLFLTVTPSASAVTNQAIGYTALKY